MYAVVDKQDMHMQLVILVLENESITSFINFNETVVGVGLDCFKCHMMPGNEYGCESG